MHGAERRQIVGREDRGECRIGFQQRTRRRVAALYRVGRVLDAALRHAGRTHCIDKPFVASRVNPRGLAADYRADPPMAERQQMRAGQLACQTKIDRDARQPRRLIGAFPHAQDHRRAARFGRMKVRKIEVRIRHEHALGKRAGDLIEIRPPGQRIFVRIADDHEVAAAARRAFDGKRELRIERIGDARHHQRQRRRAAFGEGPGGEMRAVAERVDGVQHPLPGGRADPPAIAQHVRYRGRGDAGAPRDFAEGWHGYSIYGMTVRHLHRSPRRGTICRTDKTISETGKAPRSHAIDFFGLTD